MNKIFKLNRIEPGTSVFALWKEEKGKQKEIVLLSFSFLE